MYQKVIQNIRSQTDTIILFSSLTGKDSIMLTDLCCKNFKSVISVYLYPVKDLELIKNYQSYFESKYDNIKYFHFPHYALSRWLTTGYMGCNKKKTKVYTLAKIADLMKQKFETSFAVIGFKKYDSLNRRILLNEIEKDNYIHPSTKNCYPLAELSNADVMAYIKHNRLINPLCFNEKLRSNDCDPGDMYFINYCAKHSKNDLQKIFSIFPESEIRYKIWKDENKIK